MHRKGKKEEQQPKTPAKRIMECPPGKEFVFSMPDGRAVGKAKNIVDFVALIKSAPIESVTFHVNGNHFAPWLEFIGEKETASKVARVRGNGPEVRLQIIRCV